MGFIGLYFTTEHAEKNVGVKNNLAIHVHIHDPVKIEKELFLSLLGVGELSKISTL